MHMLNNQFLSVFTQEDLSNIPDIGYDRIPAIDSLSITINVVAKQLSLLKTNKLLDLMPFHRGFEKNMQLRLLLS